MANLGTLAAAITDDAGMLEIHTIPAINVLRGGIRAISAPPPTAATISGTVRDDAGAVAQRDVIVIRRSTGELIWKGRSDPTTGAYWAPAVATEEHCVVCLDDAAGATYNDLIQRTTPI